MNPGYQKNVWMEYENRASSSSDVLGGKDFLGDLPYPQEYDYLWTDERNALEEGNGIWDPSLWFQRASDRQGVARYNPLVVGFVAGFLYTTLLLVDALLNPIESLNEIPRLQEDEMCGITTGGKVRFSRKEFYRWKQVFISE